MEETKNVDEFEINELLKCNQMMRRIYWLEEYHLMRHDLLDKVKRILDLRNLMDMTKANDRRIRKVINKYAKPCKKEKDTKKMIKKEEDILRFIGNNYISAVKDLMEYTFKILYTEAFDRDITSLEKWYEFEMVDMVLVNGMIRELSDFNSSDVDEDIILQSLNKAVCNYVQCIENDIYYPEVFDMSFPFVNIQKEEQEGNDE